LLESRIGAGTKLLHSLWYTNFFIGDGRWENQMLHKGEQTALVDWSIGSMGRQTR